MPYPVMTEALMLGGDPVYIDLDCKIEVTTWSANEEREYGPITEQGCDRCDSGRARWVPVRVPL